MIYTHIESEVEFDPDWPRLLLVHFRYYVDPDQSLPIPWARAHIQATTHIHTRTHKPSPTIRIHTLFIAVVLTTYQLMLFIALDVYTERHKNVSLRCQSPNTPPSALKDRRPIYPRGCVLMMGISCQDRYLCMCSIVYPGVCINDGH